MFRLLILSVLTAAGGAVAQSSSATTEVAPAATSTDSAASIDADTNGDLDADNDGAPDATSSMPVASSDDGNETGDDAGGAVPAGDGDVATADATSGESSGKKKKKSETKEMFDNALDAHREPVDRLNEHYLGSTSRPVRFDWRDSLFMLGVGGGELIERNNFGSFRIGAMARKAFLSIMFEGAVNYVYVVGTESSDLLALTPYRQPSRPSRLEFDVNVSYPIFEGVVTPIADFIPPSEMVFSVTGGARYLFYPETLVGDRNWESLSTWTNQVTWQEIGQGLATARMTDENRQILERRALGGMSVDRGLFHTLAGFTFDAYYQPGFFFTSRALLAIPALATVTDSRLGFWWEISGALGWAF